MSKIPKLARSQKRNKRSKEERGYPPPYPAKPSRLEQAVQEGIDVHPEGLPHPNKAVANPVVSTVQPSSEATSLATLAAAMQAFAPPGESLETTRGIIDICEPDLQGLPIPGLPDTDPDRLAQSMAIVAGDQPPRYVEPEAPADPGVAIFDAATDGPDIPDDPDERRAWREQRFRRFTMEEVVAEHGPIPEDPAERHAWKQATYHQRYGMTAVEEDQPDASLTAVQRKILDALPQSDT